MTEVFLRFFQHATDSFLFRDVVVQFLNVSFRLFRALMFELGASAFSFLGMPGRSFYFAHVAVVAEVNDNNNGNTDEERPESRRADAVNDETGPGRARKITNGHPQEVAAPHAPDRLVGFERADSGPDYGMDQVLNQSHHAKGDDGDRGAAIDEVGGGSEDELHS